MSGLFVAIWAWLVGREDNGKAIADHMAEKVGRETGYYAHYVGEDGRRYCFAHKLYQCEHCGD